MASATHAVLSAKPSSAPRARATQSGARAAVPAGRALARGAPARLSRAAGRGALAVRASVADDKKFARPGAVEVKEGKGGLEMVSLPTRLRTPRACHARSRQPAAVARRGCALLALMRRIGPDFAALRLGCAARRKGKHRRGLPVWRRVHVVEDGRSRRAVRAPGRQVRQEQADLGARCADARWPWIGRCGLRRGGASLTRHARRRQGGIPHCFPQFGPGASRRPPRGAGCSASERGADASAPTHAGKMQLHGFARNLDWALTGTTGACPQRPQLLRRLPTRPHGSSPRSPRLAQAARARRLR